MAGVLRVGGDDAKTNLHPRKQPAVRVCGQYIMCCCAPHYRFFAPNDSPNPYKEKGKDFLLQGLKDQVKLQSQN